MSISEKVQESVPEAADEAVAGQAVQHTPDSEECAKVESWSPEGDDEASHASASAAQVDEDAVISAIATVHDPEIPVNIYELGLIYAIDLYDDGKVKIEMTLTAPNCPSAQELPLQVKEAVEKVPGVGAATVDIVWDPPWDMSRMSDEARLALNMF